uniref:Catechol 2,3-dioxygenase n=1 Tax=Candidatus Kentrum sp. LFY TaxID=2126342 RepID=A0A450UJ94_9GAMM|nr:MAG: Catechol 2,3-dioxygenase [Candidatus Kentron sp. LFY]
MAIRGPLESNQGDLGSPRGPNGFAPWGPDEDQWHRKAIGHGLQAMILKLHHVAVPVSDLDSAISFYSDVLGFHRIERPDSLAGFGAWLQGYGFQIHLTEDRTFRGKKLTDNPTLPDSRHFCLFVDDIDGFREYLIRRKVTVGEIMEIAVDGHQFFVCDPAGNVIEITDIPL